jgi:transcriptional regulator with XRE-family HTH domain
VQRRVDSLTDTGNSKDSPLASLLRLPETLIPESVTNFVISNKFVYLHRQLISIANIHQKMYIAKLFSKFLNFSIYMRGKEIKDILSQKGVSQADIAKILGTSAANLNNMLAKDDVRTGLLESIAQAANIPISVFYGDSYTVQGNNNALATGDNSTASSSDDRLLALLMSKDAQLTLSMQQTSKAQEQITELIGMMKR